MGKNLNKQIKSIEREKIIGEGTIERLKGDFIEEIKKADINELLGTKPIKDLLSMQEELERDKKISESVREKVRKGLGLKKN